jgi:ParB-like chromosome segregation protein Spo0J
VSEQPLEPATEAALRESIRRFGVLVPVVRDQHGRLLDGHHRARLADELGISYRVDELIVENDDHAAEITRTLNEDRRHVPAEARRPMVAALREDGHSIRAIAETVGVGKSTVADDLKKFPVRARTPESRRLLTPDEKAAIVRRAAAGEKQREIAADLGVNPSAVSKVVNDARRAAGAAPRPSPPPQKRDQTARLLKKVQDAVAAWREAEDEWWLTIPEAARRARVLADLIPFLEERRTKYAGHGSKLLGEDKR